MPQRFEDLGSQRRSADAGGLESYRTAAKYFVQVLEPPRGYDDEAAPVDRCAALEALFRRCVMAVFLPPEGLTWPYIDGIAGFGSPSGAVYLWAAFLGEVALAERSSARDRDFATCGLATGYVIRDLRGFGPGWGACAGGKDDWVSRKEPKRRVPPPPWPRRGMYPSDQPPSGGSGEGLPDLGRALERCSGADGPSAPAREVARLALDGIGILEPAWFGRRVARHLQSLLGAQTSAGGADERRHGVRGGKPASNEFDLTSSTGHFKLAGQELGWFRGGPGARSWRRVTRAGAEGRLLVSLLAPGGVPAAVRPEVVSHLRAALRETAVQLEGRGQTLQLRPYGSLSPFARSVLKLK